MAKPTKSPVPKGKREVFSSFITTKNGRRIYAKEKGLRAFRFFVTK